MSLFGDDDPEDAWDEADPVEIKVAILLRMLLHVAMERTDPGHSHQRTVVRIAFALGALQRLLALRLKAIESVLIALLIGFQLEQADEGP
jgi:hypothetical protein